MAFENEIVERWKARAGRAPTEIRQLVRRTGRRMLIVSKRHMREQIYRIPEDTTKSGRKKWARTRRLLLGEKLEYAPDGSGVTLTNAVVYARARHELGRDGRKTSRPAHWREGIYGELLEEVHADMVSTQHRIIRGGRG